MKIEDENNELNNEINPSYFNDVFSKQGIFSFFAVNDSFGLNPDGLPSRRGPVPFLDDDIYNSFEPIYKDIDKRNNDIYDQTHNTSKKLDIIMEGKKENNSSLKIESKNKKSITFITHKTRRTKNPDKIKHKFDAFDNLTDRIQTNFNNFLISLANDVSNNIFSFRNDFPKNYFKKLDYDESKALNEINDKKYRDIFKLKISKKNVGIENLIYENVKYINKDNYENIIKKSPLLDEFFDKSYLDLFVNYYYKNVREFDFKGIHFKLSENTKTYKDLLLKGQNSSVEEKFENVINKKYLNINNK